MTSADPPMRSRPKQERGQQTYELILDRTGDLLAEVGIDRISTNMICARASISPPALYRYFVDKYAVLEALGRRLMGRQNAALDEWIARHEAGGAAALRSQVEDLLRATAAVTASEPGAVWILRALHASPKLIHVRLESHRYVTDRLADAYMRLGSRLDRAELWRRLRISVEIGFAIDEMLQEETGLSADETFRYAARLMQADLSR